MRYSWVFPNLIKMKTLQLLLLATVWSSASGSLDSISEDYNDMMNDLPARAIEDIVSKQGDMIDLLSAYEVLRDNFKDVYNHESRTPFLTKKKQPVSDTEDVDIHTDVIFVGFPAAAVESVRSKWFEPLTHEELGSERRETVWSLSAVGVEI